MLVQAIIHCIVVTILLIDVASPMEFVEHIKPFVPEMNRFAYRSEFVRLEPR
jgi:hypothetical protein